MTRGTRGEKRASRTARAKGRLRVAVVIGTRPEAVKMAPVVLALREARDRFETRVILTAQHREMSDDILAHFGIRADHDLNVMRPKQSLFVTTARLISGMEAVLRTDRPDVVLVQGDTTTTFVGALAAFYQRIRVGHVEAGLRTEDKANPFPEEVNRRLTSQIADLHFAPTATARRALLRERVDPRSVHVTGNTVIDALLWTKKRLPKRSPGALRGIDASKRLVLVTSHRRENWGEPLVDVCLALEDLANSFAGDIQIVFPVHPNPTVRDTVTKILGRISNVLLLPPLDYGAFVSVMSRSTLILTDSGGVQEEAPSLGVPVLVLRRKTERPEAVRAGVVRLVGTDRARIVRVATRLLTDRAAYRAMARRKNPYGDGRAAARIVRVLAGLPA
ncbi:MAG: non-hydrolyzing UDP-N-acetylglucosamine 2-epimerase [bacterium]